MRSVTVRKSRRGNAGLSAQPRGQRWLRLSASDGLLGRRRQPSPPQLREQPHSSSPHKLNALRVRRLATLFSHSGAATLCHGAGPHCDSNPGSTIRKNANRSAQRGWM